MTLDELLDVAREQRATARFLSRRLWYRTILLAGFSIISFVAALAGNDPIFGLALGGFAIALIEWAKVANDVRLLNRDIRQTARDFRDLARLRRGR